jgi:hypothetical protein
LRVPDHRKMAGGGGWSSPAVRMRKADPCTGFAGDIHLLHFWITVGTNSIFW